MADTRDMPTTLSNIILSSHESKWIAIAPDYSRVIGAAESLSDLVRKVPDTEAIFHRVLPGDVSFAPATH